MAADESLVSVRIGPIDAAKMTDPSQDGDVIGILKGIFDLTQIGGGGGIAATVSIIKNVKGTSIVAINAQAANYISAEFDMRFWEGTHVDFRITGVGEWTIALHGSDVSGATFAQEELNGSPIIRSGLTENVGFSFSCPPKYAKLVATEQSGTATITCTVTPIVNGI